MDGRGSVTNAGAAAICDWIRGATGRSVGTTIHGAGPVGAARPRAPTPEARV